nr:hypothetical protein BaRGS_014781 [Batillaria attramentaria]
MKMCLGQVVVLAMMAMVASYQEFNSLIPNGDNVVNPCDGSPWRGDFKAAGLVWTRELCVRDSDGDGVLVLALVAIVLGHPQYQTLIPNGANVVVPCDNSPWPGAFRAAGHVWTKALCEADSDGLNGCDTGPGHSGDEHGHHTGK